MTIKKNPGRPILSLQILQYLSLNFSKKVRREIEVTIKGFDQIIKLAELLLLTSTISM